VHDALLAHLREHGACFMMELTGALGRVSPGWAAQEVEAALWDLVWDGWITNDTFAPLRSLGRAGSRRRGRGVTTASGGRWSLVERLGTAQVTETERRLARIWMLLDRYGLVTREVVAGEDIPGGFGALYEVLKELEQAGRVRRGYFVEGLAGAQFAHLGAVERLRSHQSDVDGRPPSRDGSPLLLHATDPANPYGSVLPWPQTRRTALGPRRSAGAWVVLAASGPVLYLSASGRQLLTFSGAEPPELLRAGLERLRELPAFARRGSLLIERIDGEPAREAAMRHLLLDLGFVTDYRGLVLEKRFA
jgi:ATP-dependent Lhr-like helicase